MTPKDLIYLIEEVLEKKLDINEDSTLFGNGEIDSMSLVQICLKLEEEAEKHNFEFDWTSEKAMSKMNSMFKTVKTLTEEFNTQRENGK